MSAPLLPELSVTATFLVLRHTRLCDLLSQWVSELPPHIFERIDVSPQILAEIGIGAEGHTSPQLITRVTVDDMIAAMGWRPTTKNRAGSGSRPDATPFPDPAMPALRPAGAASHKPETACD